MGRAVALVAAALLAAGCGAEERPAACVPDEAVRTPDAFVPETSVEGDPTVLPLTFHDGTTAELVYPPDLDLARLGVTPQGSASLQGKSPTAPLRSDVVSRDFWIFRGQARDVLAALNGGCAPDLLAEYEGGDGRRVGFWDFSADRTADYLAFQFGRWVVLVYDYAADGSESAAAMTDAERALWARSLSGRETADGFLLLDGVGPLSLRRAGTTHGPTLSLGTVDRRRWLTLYPGACRHDVSRTNWCVSESMRIQVEGTGEFVEALRRDLGVRDVVMR